MTTHCGIDFGTSNSGVGAATATGVRLLPLQQTHTSVPTALFFSFEDASTSFGREAMARYLEREEGRLLRAIKSLLGTSLYDELTPIKSRRIAFAEIIAEFLRFLRAAAARELGQPPDRVVIGRPAFFVDEDAAADRMAQGQLEAAARAAGFSDIEFQFEPIAAALDYEQAVRGEEIALVADIGGGTSDFSIVRVSPKRARMPDRRGDILAYTGVHIGGTDFDRLLSMAALMPFLGLRSKLRDAGMSAPSWYFSDLATWHRINRLYDPKTMTEIRGVLKDSAEPEKLSRLVAVLEQRKGHDLLGRIEQAKIAVSAADSAKISLSDLADRTALLIKRERLERAIAEQLARIATSVRAILQLSSLKPDAVSTLFLTGGSSGIPAVRDAILGVVPGAKVVAGDAFGSVATGLALDAARKFGPAGRFRQAGE